MKTIAFITLFSLSAFGSTQVELNKSFNDISAKANEFERFDSGNGRFPELNISIKECSSFPYFKGQTSDLSRLKDSFRSSFEGLRSCLDHGNIPDYVQDKYYKLTEILLDKSLEKTLSCDFGDSFSWLAVATAEKDEVNYPKITFNTLRMSGNFKKNMSESDITNTFNFYGGKIPRDQIDSGLINPLANYITNPTSLVLHEMLHWTGFVHSNKSYPDLIYLTQACCFYQKGLSEDLKKRSCDALFDDSLFQGEEEKRIEAMNKSNIKKLIREINSALHSVPNASRL